MGGGRGPGDLADAEEAGQEVVLDRGRPRDRRGVGLGRAAVDGDGARPRRARRRGYRRRGREESEERRSRFDL